MTSTLKHALDRDGFVIVDGLVPSDELAELRTACDRVVARTRSGAWSHRRVVGKQFPPYDSNNPDSWGVQHVMHPLLGEPAFVRWYTSDGLTKTVQALLECEEGCLQMELFNLLINPESHDFALRWHRDDVRENSTEEEEVKALNLWHHGIQWNTALYEDACLFVVPGSHKVPRSPAQRALSVTQDAPKQPLDMPDSVQVTLEPGQTVFYNSNILHCGAYTCASKRATLHASMGDTRGGTARARNVLQHGLEWMRGEEFRKSLPGGKEGRSVGMLERLLEMEKGAGRIEFSLSG